PVSATAEAGPLTVTAEARPVRYLWDFGDGTELGTTRPGRPWTQARPGDVSHLYEAKGRYEVGAEVVWAARWRTNGGPWRDLGYFTTESSAGYPVREMVAVLVRRR
ncbi:MAG: PKD domain-containing protein, partial [Actinomycetota bacterium]|nr:PKD domain-containing protein [Actinomycetota bacterium]